MSHVRFAAPLGACLWLMACQQNGPTGGPVSGPVDGHCYVLPDGGFPGGSFQPQAVSQASCFVGADGGVEPPPSYGATHANSASADDDCKYLVGWWSTPIQQGVNVTFYVSVAYALDGTPMTGAAANSIAEVFLNSSHPAPNSSQVTAEVSPGLYSIGPIRFDKSGQWTTRFHFNEECYDVASDSPHGHAAFFVNVP